MNDVYINDCLYISVRDSLNNITEITNSHYVPVFYLFLMSLLDLYSEIRDGYIGNSCRCLVNLEPDP
jgi:hypothetical protein